MSYKIERILLSHEQIVNRSKEIGAQISKDYAGKRPLLIGMLNGAVPFFAELIKHIEGEIETAFIKASSYAGQTCSSSGSVVFTGDLNLQIAGRDIIVIEDIVDTGLTIKTVCAFIREKKPKSLAVATLLDKKSRRLVEVDVKYVGFDIPNVFVVGFGLDYDELFRNLPYVGVLDSSSI